MKVSKFLLLAHKKQQIVFGILIPNTIASVLLFSHKLEKAI